ncbi:LysM peptidoglycan-binding domain-containing protein [Chondromyces crocatus]|uniref:LysM peptidoglycan-binding domain-containing protein n=1 Tax=Chondromyces crocatus TaxID=52 RepID=UPI001FDF9221|nr:penicillin-insensitive murein endopeptidase [Chondromyces crocatus]
MLLLGACATSPARTARHGAGHPPGGPDTSSRAAESADTSLHATADGQTDDLEACDHEGEDDPDDEVDDTSEQASAGGARAQPPVSPLAALTDADIERMVREDPASLGSLSLGATNAGRLFNGVQMPEGEGWSHISPAFAWGTQETVDYLVRAIRATRRKHPDSPPLYLGHISAKHGGPLSPHVSHQAGRDVDISYYLTPQKPGFHRATAQNLDRERSWAFVRALITETDVEMILIDSGVQRLLREYALASGEDPAWIDQVFQYGSRSPRPIIRHARGHANHLHIRFFSPIAQASAARAHRFLAKQGVVQPAVKYIRHVVKNGQTLGILAKRYGVTVEAIQRANNLKGTFIKAKRILNIPRPGAAAEPPALRPPVIPARRLPPEQSASSAPARRPSAGG